MKIQPCVSKQTAEGTVPIKETEKYILNQVSEKAVLHVVGTTRQEHNI